MFEDSTESMFKHHRQFVKSDNTKGLNKLFKFAGNLQEYLILCLCILWNSGKIWIAGFSMDLRLDYFSLG